MTKIVCNTCCKTLKRGGKDVVYTICEECQDRMDDERAIDIDDIDLFNTGNADLPNDIIREDSFYLKLTDDGKRLAILEEDYNMYCEVPVDKIKKLFKKTI